MLGASRPEGVPKTTVFETDKSCYKTSFVLYTIHVYELFRRKPLKSKGLGPKSRVVVYKL